MTDKSVIFIYCNGKMIEGKISNEIVNDELIETIRNLIEPVNADEYSELRTEIKRNLYNGF